MSELKEEAEFFQTSRKCDLYKGEWTLDCDLNLIQDSESMKVSSRLSSKYVERGPSVHFMHNDCRWRVDKYVCDFVNDPA